MTTIPAATAPPDPGAGGAPGVFTAEQVQEITAARKRAGKLRRAVRVAWFDAVCTAMFAAMTFMAGILMGFDLTSLFMGLGMAAIAYNSFRGAGELKRYEIKAAKRLGWNQIAFCSLICAYCVFMIINGLLNAEEMLKPIADYMSKMGSLSGQQGNAQDMAQLIKLIYCAVYGAIILASLLTQGLTALYYFTRAGHIRAFTDKTPSWVIELLKAI